MNCFKVREVLFGVVLSLNVQPMVAQPATFEDGILTIPHAALIDGMSPVYYSNVQLSSNADGSLSVVAGEPQNLVTVDSVEVMIMESFPVQVSLAVSGNKSVPCVELLPAAVSRSGNQFSVVMAESVLGPAESCIAVIDPFEQSVSLDVEGLPAGTYNVDVNGVSAEFTLDMDNTLGN
ncbi:MAG: hypothetical protein RL839_08350 [Gammaproteobacteria bacterium]